MEFEGISLAGSAMAVISTFYFWLVRANREKASLKAYVVDRFTGSWANTVRSSGSSIPESHVLSRYFVKVAVANYSSLPNAILRLKAWIKMPNGEWKAADASVGEGYGLPLNVAPMSTTAMEIKLEIVVPGSLDGTGFREREEGAFTSIASPAEIKLEMLALGERRFTDVLVDIKHEMPEA